MAGIPSEEMIGKKYGRLTILEEAGQDKKKKKLYKCKCNCGNEKILHGYRLRNGSTISCGCVWKKNKIAYFKGILRETDPIISQSFTTKRPVNNAHYLQFKGENNGSH